MNLQSSTLKDDETGEPLHVQQRKQIEAYREAWKDAGHRREPRVSVSRSIFALVDDRDRAYLGRDARDQDQVGYIDANTRAIFGRSYARNPTYWSKNSPATRRSRRPTRCSSRSRTSWVWTTTPTCSKASSRMSLRNSAGADLDFL